MRLQEPLLLLTSFTSTTTALASPLARMDIRLRVSGGGHTSQIYALRQAVAKAVVAYVAKYEDAASALEVKKVFTAYDRSLLVADPRRCEPKKFGGKGARSRFQKSYVAHSMPPLNSSRVARRSADPEPRAPTATVKSAPGFFWFLHIRPSTHSDLDLPALVLRLLRTLVCRKS